MVQTDRQTSLSPQDYHYNVVQQKLQPETLSVTQREENRWQVQSRQIAGGVRMKKGDSW